uniref:ARAD1C16874p n=1 Tax=Blastobotrys adeninivorans TaxID=409370 RepID=A0A060T1J1_BLAAD
MAKKSLQSVQRRRSSSADSYRPEQDSPERERASRGSLGPNTRLHAVEKKTVRINSSRVQNTWSRLSDHGRASAIQILSNCAVPVLNQVRGDKLRHEVHELLSQFVNQATDQLESLRVPPTTKDVFFRTDSITKTCVQLERALGPLLDQVARIEDQLQAEKAKLASDSQYLEKLRKDHARHVNSDTRATKSALELVQSADSPSSADSDVDDYLDQTELNELNDLQDSSFDTSQRADSDKLDGPLHHLGNQVCGKLALQLNKLQSETAGIRQLLQTAEAIELQLTNPTTKPN